MKMAKKPPSAKGMIKKKRTFSENVMLVMSILIAVSMVISLVASLFAVGF